MIASLSKKLNHGHERSVKARKNIIESVLTKGGSIIINFALVPATINYVSPAEYGVWLTLSSIIAWFSFFDIGFGHGLRNKFAEAVANGDKKLAQAYVSTTYFILTMTVVVLWILFFTINIFLDWSKILNTSSNLSEELSRVALTVFSFFCVQFVFQLIGTILTANQQAAKSSLFLFISNLCSLIAIIILSKVSKEGSLMMLATITGTFQVIILFGASIWFFSKKLKEYAPKYSLIDISHAKHLMGLGMKFFVIQIAAVLMFQTTNIVITQLLGAEKVTVYNIAFKYFSASTMLLGIITTPYWSAFTEAHTKKDFEWMRKIINQLTKVWYVVVIIIVAMLLLSNTIFKLWIGDKITIPFALSVLMACTMICNTRYSMFIILINGTGKIKLQLLLNVILSVMFIPLSISLGRVYGLNGIMSANLIVSVIYALVAPIQGKKIINQSATGIWNK